MGSKMSPQGQGYCHLCKGHLFNLFFIKGLYALQDTHTLQTHTQT